MRDKQREETRRRVYLAALDIFRRDGVANCRIEDIAVKAEVSRGAFYFHYPTKDDVLIELLRESEKPIAAALTELPDDTKLSVVLDTLAKALHGFWSNEAKLLPDVATVALKMTAVINDREAEPVRASLSRLFSAAAKRGELSDVLPSDVLADFFLCNALAAMMSWAGNPQLPLEMVLGGVTHLFLNGAGPRP